MSADEESLLPHPSFRMVEPDFDSHLTQLIIDLDYLRRKKEWGGTTPTYLFEQIRSTFFMLESFSSARIEGNRTTIAEYIQEKVSPAASKPHSIREIANLENALRFIEETARDNPINSLYIRELHKQVVAGLPVQEEGDHTPGEFRRGEVRIVNSGHRPPVYGDVPILIDQMVAELEKPRQPRYDLLKMALSHHRFVWIHPFTNGNGRSARLFTYALLVKYGFALEAGRIANPASVFCATRDEYYRRLQVADTATESDPHDPQGLLDWCEYVLAGLKEEIGKVEKLTDYAFLSKKVLIPAIKNSRLYDDITPDEEQVLMLTTKTPEIKVADVNQLLGKSNSTCTRIIESLRKKGMLAGETETSRKYRLQITNNALLKGIIQAFVDNQLLPTSIVK